MALLGPLARVAYYSKKNLMRIGECAIRPMLLTKYELYTETTPLDIQIFDLGLVNYRICIGTDHGEFTIYDRNCVLDDNDHTERRLQTELRSSIDRALGLVPKFKGLHPVNECIVGVKMERYTHPKTNPEMWCTFVARHTDNIPLHRPTTLGVSMSEFEKYLMFKEE